MRRAKMREDIRFSAKGVSGAAVGAVVLSVCSVILMPAAVWISYLSGGKAGSQVGAIGMLALIIGLIGCVLGISESHNEAINRKVPRAGTRIGGIAVLLWGIVFVMGLVA